MVPGSWVELDDLPKTVNGKVDRNALAALRPDGFEPSSAYVAPRTAREERLAAVWADVLAVPRVGVRENFFELGGDSLQAIRLIEQIQRNFGRRIQLAALFQAPTVELLLRHIDAADDDQPWTPLVPIQPGGDRRPIFICHPTLGVVFPYYELARCLGADQPVYGLQARGLDGQLDPAASIEEMAGHYIDAVRSVDPTGPYALAGWSSGSFIAYEMARQLAAAGHEVRLVALIDNQAPLEYRTSFYSRDAMRMHLTTLKFIVTTGIRHVGPYLRQYFSLGNAQSPADPARRAGSATRASAVVHRIGSFTTNRRRGRSADVADGPPLAARVEPLTLGPLLRVSRSMVKAIFRYAPDPYPGELTLFRTGTSLDSKLRHDPSLGWSALTEKRLVVEQLPGNHMTLMLPPHVEVLAARLSAALDQ